MTSSAQQPSTVVVGVSTRSTSRGALLWAAGLAAERGDRLVVVRAWRPLPAQAGSRGTPSAVPADRRAAEREAREQLDLEVADVLGADHRAEVRLVHGGKRKTLLTVSQDADLLVIEAPRPLEIQNGPGFVQRLVQRASCPVVVVPRQLAGKSSTDAGGRAWRRTASSVGRGIADAAARAPRPGLGHLQPGTQAGPGARGSSDPDGEEAGE